MSVCWQLEIDRSLKAGDGKVAFFWWILRQNGKQQRRRNNSIQLTHWAPTRVPRVGKENSVSNMRNMMMGLKRNKCVDPFSGCAAFSGSVVNRKWNVLNIGIHHTIHIRPIFTLFKCTFLCHFLHSCFRLSPPSLCFFLSATLFGEGCVKNLEIYRIVSCERNC